MTPIDAATAAARTFDLCIVGAGPAGLALALAYARSGKTTLVVEQGGPHPSPQTDDLVGAEIVEPSTHVPLEEAISPAIGGTSHRWGGRVVPFDRCDFENSDSPPDRGWPIAFEDYEKWVAPAARLLGCEEGFRTSQAPGWEKVEGLQTDTVEQLSPAVDVSQINQAALDDTPDLHILSQAVAVGFEWEEGAGGGQSATVAALNVRLTNSQALGEQVTLKAGQFAICAGGLETTRLLLIEQQRNPSLFGGPDGPLGKSYMGHLTGSIAQIRFNHRKGHAPFGYCKIKNCGLARRRFTLSPPGPANIAFWVENLPMRDARHGSGELSLKYLLLQSAALGRTMISDPLRKAAVSGGRRDVGAHIGNVLRQPLSSISSVASAVYSRLAVAERPHDKLLDSSNRTYQLRYHAEHVSNAESRVGLSQRTDHFGRPRLRLNLHFNERDYRAVLNAHERLLAAINPSSLATIAYTDQQSALIEAIRQQARDGYHQIGTTRMSASNSSGVVDPDCKVHGTANLFIASASVFPVSSQANPTLSIAALALRLANHLLK
ncbi:MAG: GMC family oxidoreductase [Alphaproteobacteria bacterium]|nr:GMC family oxidoreductase [Alphaproteobacteria bacterium]